MTALIEELRLARDLLDHGIPVVVCQPNPVWQPGSPTHDLLHPSGWSTITTAECDLSTFRPGVDTLAMVGGHGVDVVDVDTKDDGSVENLPPFRHFGIHGTPSGGGHYLVRSTGIGKISPLDSSAGHVGDYVGGTEAGGGRMLAYLPGSTRPKYPGKSYTIKQRVDLDELLEHDADDDLVGALMNVGGDRNREAGNRPAKRSEVVTFYADHSATPEPACGYGRAAVAGILADADAVVPGDKKRGRHGWTVKSTTRLVGLIRAGCATSADLDAVEGKLSEIKPEGGTDFGGVVAWALSNATGGTPCGVHAADEWVRSLSDTTVGEDPGPAGRRLRLTAASTIKPQRVKWAWSHRMALGTLGLLGGREGSGKSTIAYWIAARLTRGELPGEHFGTPRAVLVCATEDSWSHTIVPRLIAAGADLQRVYQTEVISADEIHVGLVLPRDVHRVEEAATETGAAMLLLDPLMSRVDAKLDTHRDGELRQALEPVAALADRTGVLVLGLIHFNKTGSTDVLDRIMGSKAFVAVARSVSVVVPDPDDESGQRRLFGTPKNNMGRTDLPSLGFTIEGYALETDDGPTSVGQVVFGAETDVTVTEAMERIGEDPDVRTAQGEAKEWLREHLTEHGGSANSAGVKREAAKAGHSESTLHRARKSLRVRSETMPGEVPRQTLWCLPVYAKSPWGGGITDITGINAGQGVSAPDGGTTSRVSYSSYAMPPREVAQTDDGDQLFDPATGITADCPSCQVPVDQPPGAGCGCADVHGEVA